VAREQGGQVALALALDGLVQLVGDEGVDRRARAPLCPSARPSPAAREGPYDRGGDEPVRWSTRSGARTRP
ncbi:hypothetical protein ABZ114_25975, partial [Streptomyces albidoflavus]|uniref:hypothetical protein n=1 Tax=Streptomyces albidoflavus TaxID=1886 RepID=UPI0033AB2F95